MSSSGPFLFVLPKNLAICYLSFNEIFVQCHGLRWSCLYLALEIGQLFVGICESIMNISGVINMKNTTKKYFTLVFTAVFTLQLVACGTILYPERRGSTGGRVDPLVVGLDAIGLIFFLVPGVIAFAVDFTTGAIYMSGGRASVDDGSLNSDVVTIKVAPEELTAEKIQAIIKQQKGFDVDMKGQNLSAVQVKDIETAKSFILAMNNFGYQSSGLMVVAR